MSSSGVQMIGIRWPSLSQTPSDPPRDLCVRKVLTVPGYQKVDPVDGRHRDVRGITDRVGRKYADRHNRLGQHFRILGHLQSRQSANDRQSLLHFGWVAGRGLVDNNLRYTAVEFAASGRPPFDCRLLVGGHDQVPTRPGNQAADERGF
jgi:hypothetical protein